HVFAIASTMSFGPSGSSINAMTTAVRKLVDGLTRGLFKGDLERHWRSLLAYDAPQAVPGASSNTNGALATWLGAPSLEQEQRHPATRAAARFYTSVASSWRGHARPTPYRRAQNMHAHCRGTTPPVAGLNVLSRRADRVGAGRSR